jgi:amidase
MANELWRFSATELASKIAQREVSSREVVSDFLERIAAVGPAVNAVVETFPEATLAWADAADARQRSGESLGILHGVP